jgi:hypothetical protein
VRHSIERGVSADGLGEDGKRKYIVAQIAAEFGVTRHHPPPPSNSGV